MASPGVLWGHGQGQQRPAGGVGPSPALPIRERCGVLTSSNPRPKVGLQAWRITSAAGAPLGSGHLQHSSSGSGAGGDFTITSSFLGFVRLAVCLKVLRFQARYLFEPLEHVTQEARWSLHCSGRVRLFKTQVWCCLITKRTLVLKENLWCPNPILNLHAGAA